MLKVRSPDDFIMTASTGRIAGADASGAAVHRDKMANTILCQSVCLYRYWNNGCQWLRLVH